MKLSKEIRSEDIIGVCNSLISLTDTHLIPDPYTDMPRRARIHYVSLRSSLVNLPISIYGPLLERGVVSQIVYVNFTMTDCAA